MKTRIMYFLFSLLLTVVSFGCSGGGSQANTPGAGRLAVNIGFESQTALSAGPGTDIESLYLEFIPVSPGSFTPPSVDLMPYLLGNNKSLSIHNLTDNETYYVKVAAWGGANNVTYYGSNSVLIQPSPAVNTVNILAKRNTNQVYTSTVPKYSVASYYDGSPNVKLDIKVDGANISGAYVNMSTNPTSLSLYVESKDVDNGTLVNAAMGTQQLKNDGLHYDQGANDKVFMMRYRTSPSVTTGEAFSTTIVFTNAFGQPDILRVSDSVKKIYSAGPYITSFFQNVTTASDLTVQWSLPPNQAPNEFDKVEFIYGTADHSAVHKEVELSAPATSYTIPAGDLRAGAYFVSVMIRKASGSDYAGDLREFTVSSATAATTHSISGTVTYGTGTGLAGVYVLLMGSTHGFTVTDANGNYSFSGLQSGSYDLTASLAGYVFSPNRYYVTLTNANVTGQNFTAQVLLGGAIQGSPLSLSNQVTTFVGSAGAQGSTDGTGTAARFYHPTSMATDGVSLYVGDNAVIRKIVIATGVVTTLAGSPGLYGTTDGIGSAARLGYIGGITTDGTNLYITDGDPNPTGGGIVRKIVISTGEVTTIAGNAAQAGSADGTGTAALFKGSLKGITTDGTNLYVADTNNQTIRKIVISTAAVTTLAGSTNQTGSTDGTGSAARFYFPSDLTTDGTNLYVADSGDNIIRKVVISTRAVTTLAGSPVIISAVGGWSSAYSVDGTGSAARFYGPSGLTTDGTNLYLADSNNQTIRKIVIMTGAVTTIAGSPGQSGSTDGTGSAARFWFPVSVTTDGTSLYVTDSMNNAVRKIQ